ncbi:hypothetical protein DPMN_139397 [Dreissena polymorpha]|uniref:Uncharacterized protein n=1 Tax=Dreissena polymorpha TaxID=45954 RepID=A0A9D4JKR4_DREPO|nr:hypothetical protein DPMN_139397 [Dreissena polymorpha]
MKSGIKRRISSNLEGSEAFRVARKHRAVDSDTDDTVSISSEASSAARRPIRKRVSLTRKDSSGNKAKLTNKESTIQGVVTSFLALRSRTIAREVSLIEDDEGGENPPKPRKMRRAKRCLYKNSSSVGDFGATVSGLRRKFSESRAATAVF